MPQIIYRIFIVISLITISAFSQTNAQQNMDDVKEVTRDIIGNNAFLYYRNYDEAVNFYGNSMGFKNVFEFPGFAIIYQTSPTTFITLVNDDGSGRGMHSADEPKTIAIALLTDQVEEWHEYAVSQNMDIRNPPKPLGE